MPFDKLFNTFSSAILGFSKLPVVRQIGLLIGFSASIAIGLSVVLWTKDANYRPLYGYLSPQETTDILDTLNENHIPYKLDNKTNTILVPDEEVYKARLQVASHGLPNNNGVGFEMLDKDFGLGTSRFMENARFRRALEGELSRTIGTLEYVKNARVHLALPKESVFVNDNRKASASVVIDLSNGTSLDKKQVLAIMQLVASSVPNMQASEVSVIDQRGHLLSYDITGDEFSMTREQLNYTNQIKSDYEKRIETMLWPLFGENKIRVRVNADVDFNKIEQTQESFQPNSSVVRSEQLSDEQLPPNSRAPGGIPGTLSNQPPPTPTVANHTAAPNPNAAGDSNDPNNPVKNSDNSLKKNQIRNFEIGKTISHSNIASGKINKISVAVVADNKMIKDPKTGKPVSVPLSKQDIDNIRDLVENAVGFDAARGDKISVVNIPFIIDEESGVVVKNAFWKEPWFLEIIRMVGGGIMLMVLLLLVLRPVLKSLATAKIDPLLMSQRLLSADVPLDHRIGHEEQLMSDDKLTLSQNGENKTQMPVISGNSEWQAVKTMAVDDPKRLAQVMKSWLGDDTNG